MDQYATWYGGRPGLGPGDFVFDGDPLRPEKKSHTPHPIFGPCLLWPSCMVKMPLGTEVNVGSGDVVLDGVAAPP